MREDGDSGGEAASLREAPLPQTPSPEERWGISLTLPLDLRAPASWATGSCEWVMVTAADRAAATCQRWGPCSYYRSCSFLTYKSGNDHERRCRFFASRALHVRGGSVSRRGLNQTARNRTHLTGGTNSAEATTLNASRSSGERGLGGEALLSEKPPLPPEFLTPSQLQ